jgi:RNA polymerase sigma-70 factor, ECF subfamily
MDVNLDTDAHLEETIRRLAPRVLRYAIARTGDQSTGEDVAQESLEALIRHWRRAGAPESAEAFVFSIARRRAVRSVIRRKLFVPIEQAFGRHDDSPSPEAQIVSRADHNRARAALARLPRHDREALLLVALGEVSSSEAAVVLGLSVSALKMRIHRARKRLAAELEDGHDHRTERARGREASRGVCG